MASKTKQKSRCKIPDDAPRTLSANVAGEDLRAGDYITPFTQTYEIPSFFWCHDACVLPPEEAVRMSLIPREAGMPLKVVGLSLPFVYVVNPRGAARTLDLRRMRIVRLAPEGAKEMWKRMKDKPGRRGRRS